MKRALTLLLLVLGQIGLAQETYLGIYMNGNKVGYASYATSETMLGDKPARRGDVRSVISVGMLGQGMKMSSSSTSWFDMSGKPLRMDFLMESGGRKQIVQALFSGGEIRISSDNSGTKQQSVIPLPKDAPVLDDPILPLLNSDAAGSKRTFYVLDPMTVSLVRGTATFKGGAKATVRGKTYDAYRIDVDDPRAPMKVFVSAKGDLIKAVGPLGIEMIAEPRASALGSASDEYAPATDLAISSSIATDRPITDPASLLRLKLKISGEDLSKLPSDAHQTVTRSKGAWIVEVHPPIQDAGKATTIARAAAAKREWTKPGRYVSSADPAMRKLAARVIGPERNVLSAAVKIKQYVNEIMRPNAGIGVLRDATEVLRTKEGVCRDYAILTATLMRAANIPTKLTSGIVNWDGKFLYHAWVEIWDGKRWIGLDSTTPIVQITPTHIKLAEGSVEKAFIFTLLDKAEIEVLDMVRRKR